MLMTAVISMNLFSYLFVWAIATHGMYESEKKKEKKISKTVAHRLFAYICLSFPLAPTPSYPSIF